MSRAYNSSGFAVFLAGGATNSRRDGSNPCGLAAIKRIPFLSGTTWNNNIVHNYGNISDVQTWALQLWLSPNFN